MRSRIIGMALASFLAGASGLAAQRAPSSEEFREQERLVDTLVARWRSAAQALRAYDDSVDRISATRDTVRVGSLRILVEPSLRERAEAAATFASPRIDSLAGAAAKLLETRVLVLHYLKDHGQDTIVLAARSPNQNQEFLQIWGTFTDSTLGQAVYHNAQQLLSLSVDQQLKNWLIAELIPDTLPTTAWLGARLAVLSSPASIARRCYDGDLEACKVSLKLVSNGDPVMTWFDAASRRRFVTSLRVVSGPNRELAEACVGGSDTACINYMRRLEHLSDPIPPHVRTTLAAMAMQMGGRAGYERMLLATGTPLDRLAVAAGVPADSVLRAWVAKVRDSRLPSQDMTPGIAAASMGWILLCGLLSLRSTRWR
ncbi:MAG TPA: hypothetical protein VF483_13095 [Gemmatimonadaceae bacterium]